jgi:hypothetical protein
MTKRAAVGATVCLVGLAVFQLLLAAGAPFGEAAWGGDTKGRLSPALRTGSALSIVVYAVAAALMLRRAGFRVWFVPRRVARIGSWVLVVLLALGTLANFASQSPWERLVLGPVTLVLTGLCLVVASSPIGDTGDAAGQPLESRRATHRTTSQGSGRSR